MNLPPSFERRMRSLLGEEYEAFRSCYEQERCQGLRVNTEKISVERFLEITPFTLRPIPWTENGFFFRPKEDVSGHPHFYAGLYYIQEPSAMVPASRLPVHRGERVLDLCAAPGGKATELGARLGGEGFLAANDASASRAKALLRNLERFGVVNACVTGETPEHLAEQYGCSFDRILVDAPCSGEGMFRKDPSLIKSWEECGPQYYAPLQLQILSNAVQMLRPGGTILYSTCTFSVEENEQVISDILEKYPDLEVIRPEWYEGFSGGILPEDYPFAEQINAKCIRIWPHRMEGEGHFAALLRRKEESGLAAVLQTVSGGRAATMQSIGLRRLIKDDPFLAFLDYPLLEEGTVIQNKDMLLLLPERGDIPKLRYLRTGLLLGTLKNGRFEPSQALAMAMRSENYWNRLDLPASHEGVMRYLRGETLQLPETDRLKAGWVLVCCDGYPLGWGKNVNGSVRNKYNPAWRKL